MLRRSAQYAAVGTVRLALNVAWAQDESPALIDGFKRLQAAWTLKGIETPAAMHLPPFAASLKLRKRLHLASPWLPEISNPPHRAPPEPRPAEIRKNGTRKIRVRQPVECLHARRQWQWPRRSAPECVDLIGLTVLAVGFPIRCRCCSSASSYAKSKVTDVRGRSSSVREWRGSQTLAHAAMETALLDRPW